MSTKIKFELIPNESLIQCFEYLNAPDIFYSFDQLNYRFSTLIRNISLYVNFEQFKKSLFNDFCEILLSNPKIKENIICLKLSNKSTFDQIETFFSLFSLNKFIRLRSLSLIDLNNDNVKQLLQMSPFVSSLYCFSFTCQDYETSKMMHLIYKSKIRILKISQINFFSHSIYKTISFIISLTINYCDLDDLCQLLIYISMLKYLKIEYFYDNNIEEDEFNIIKLEELVTNNSNVKFKNLELLLNKMRNLKIFSIICPFQFEMVNAKRWEYLIENSLSHLYIFKFCFGYAHMDTYDEKLIKLQQFQTDFWYKQHHWYTNYEINDYLLLIYTIPYIHYEYRLISNMNRYINKSINYSNQFDNVKYLTLRIPISENDICYYFSNVESLTLSDSIDGRSNGNYSIISIKDLNSIINLSNIKHLTIEDNCYIESLLFLQILNVLLNISSLKINKWKLISYLDHYKLCESFNKKIIKLDIFNDRLFSYEGDVTEAINVLYNIFSNIEQIECNIESLDELLLILSKCPNLSIINLGRINQEIYSWIQDNRSKSTTYINCTWINYDND